ncbi:MAG: carboxypeptidase regulatory-like domain-containing protein, partial [Kofleriaceae bacterium]
EGRVRIDGLLPGRYRVLGFAEGLQAQSPVEVLAEVGAANEAVLRLVATAWIRGKVVSDGKPVAGAQVVAVRKAPTQRSPAAVSQADGSFVLERVPAGELVFTASPYEVTSPPRFEAEAGKRYDDVVLEVRALGAIRGTVTRLGKPAAGVEVCCVPTLFPPRATTDGEGHYEFRGVVPGPYQLGAGSDELGAFSLGTSFTLAAGEQRVVDLELDVAGPIAGTVVDKEGNPVPGVFVRWIHEKTGDLGRSMTDAQGRYRCGAMTGGGTYRAGVFSGPDLRAPYPTADGAPYPTRELADGKTVIEGVVLAIDRPQLAISGRVIDDAGEPVADAIVKALPAAQGEAPPFHSWLRLPMTSTDADGQFTLAGLAPGSHALQARAIDGGEGMVPAVAAGTQGVTIRLERAGAIEGKLVGFAQPPSVHARGLAEFRLTPGTVDGATFRIGGLRPGRYLVNAQTTYEGEAQIVEVRAGQATKVVLTAQGRAAIEGTVLDFRSRAPIAFATCRTVMSAEGEQAITTWDPSTAARSDERGRFVLDPTPAGSVSVACEMPSFRRSRPSADLVVAAGSRASVPLLSVEVTQENPSTVGLAFNWQVTAPRVSSVQPNSPAAKAGVLVGDLVTHVNGAAVQGLNGVGVWALIQDVPAGEEVRLAISRGGATKAFAMKAVSGL